MLACFGDNDGNQIGLQGGMRIVGPIAYPPFGFQTPDGVRILVAHIADQIREHDCGCQGDRDRGHTHKPSIRTDERGVLFVNPGETSGWTYRKPTIAILETSPSRPDRSLPEMAPPTPSVE